MTNPFIIGAAVSLALHGVVWCLLPAGFRKQSPALFQNDTCVMEVLFQEDEPAPATQELRPIFPRDPPPTTPARSVEPLDASASNVPDVLLAPEMKTPRPTTATDTRRPADEPAASLRTAEPRPTVAVPFSPAPVATPTVLTETFPSASEPILPQQDEHGAEPSAPDVARNSVPSDAQACPVRLQRARPVYPERARRLRQEGDVLLTVWINAQGGLERIEIARSSGYPLLDQAALDAERKSRFRPAQLGQQPVPCKADALYCFQLE